MGAPEDQRVDALLDQRVEVLVEDDLDDRVSGLEAAVLDEGHEERAGLHIDGGVRVVLVDGLLIGAGLDRGVGGDDADLAVLRGLRREAGGRVDDAEDGQVRIGLTDLLFGDGVRRVAGDDDRLDVERAEEPDVGEDVLGDLPFGAGAVGHVGRVAEVDDVFSRHAVDDGLDDGEAADARVEDADVTVI